MSSFVVFYSDIAEKKSPIRGQGGYLGFSISLKNTILEEDVEILCSIKFRSC